MDHVSLKYTYALVGADPTPLVTVAIDRRNVALEVDATADLAVLVNAELMLFDVLLGAGYVVARSLDLMNAADDLVGCVG